MKCPKCGSDTRGIFCTRCGTRLPVAPPATTSMHFRILAVSHSFAEQNSALIESRLERAYQAMTGLLGVALVDSARIEVHLSELMVDFGGQKLVSGGYAIPARLQIHDVYLPEAPGEDLERSLMSLLLAQALGSDRPPPAFLVDGLLALAVQSLGMFPADDQLGLRLSEARARNEIPAVTGLLATTAPPQSPVYYLVAAGFVGHLVHTYGMDRVKQFVASLLGGADTSGAAQTVLGSNLNQIEKRWLKSIRFGKPGGTLRFIKQAGVYLRPHAFKVAEIVVYLALSVAFSIGLAKMQGFLIDKALLPRDRHALAVIMAILVGSFVIVSAAALRQSYVTAYVAESVLKTMRLRMFSLVQRLHPGYFQTQRTGDIMSRITGDVGAIQFALTGSMAQGLRMILTLVAAVITICVTDWKLAVVGLLGTPLFFLSTRYLGPAAARASKERQRLLGLATSTLQENLGAQAVVKAFGLQSSATREFEADLGALFSASLRLTFLSGVYGLSASSVATAINLTVMGVGAYLVIGGSLTVGTLFTFLALMAQVIGPVQGLSGIVQGFQQASGAMDRVEELLAAQPAIVDSPGAVDLGRLTRGIELRDVSFGYNEEHPVLHSLSLAIPAGQSVALVGPSGCGKSTVLNLIMRFYDPSSGQVSFDSTDIKSASVDSVRAQLGVVFQDNVLFNTTMRENIRVGNLLATDDEVEAAARAAEIHDLIVGLPDGYDTTVGERGSRLSGGQRQRMAIARAILRNPAVLLLDEATSALDPRTEGAIVDTLKRLSRGRTTISVTHRLSSVVDMDQIFVLDRGALVEQGTHTELVKHRGLYSSLWQEQGAGALGMGMARSAIEAPRLQAIPMFAHLSPGLLATLAQHLALERFAAGDIVIHAGDIGDKMYIVQRGQVEVLGSDPLAGERSMAQLREGDFFGEMALLRDAPRMATVRARTPVELYSLSKNDLGRLLATVPALRQMMEDAIEERVKTNARRGARAAIRPAPARGKAE